jgi:RNA polymerase sigma-70 factor (ECF subfamily)
MLVYDADDPGSQVKYFVLLDWAGDQVIGIRDFVLARYAVDGAEITVME